MSSVTSSTSAVSTVFPGRWVGSVSLIAAPLVLLTGMLLRIRFGFFFPDQLRAYEVHPRLIATAAGAVALGWVLLWPGVVVLSARIGERFPETALWGGTLTMLGLSARVFHAGADHEAFQFTTVHGAPSATRTVAETYGAFHVFSVFNAAIMGGWLLLAVGAYRAGVVGPVRAIALAAASGIPLGVLKGTTWLSVAGAAGLCLALVPLGVAELRNGPRPRRAAAAGRLAVVAVAGVGMFLFGRAG